MPTVNLHVRSHASFLRILCALCCCPSLAGRSHGLGMCLPNKIKSNAFSGIPRRSLGESQGPHCLDRYQASSSPTVICNEDVRCLWVPPVYAQVNPRALLYIESAATCIQYVIICHVQTEQPYILFDNCPHRLFDLFLIESGVSPVLLRLRFPLPNQVGYLSLAVSEACELT